MAEPLNPEKLKDLLTAFLEYFEDSEDDANKKIAKKTLDPIIFSLDYVDQGQLFDWRSSALQQALRKRRENRIGKLHQELFGLVPGWRVLPQKNADPDLVNDERKIIIELKSREDTVKKSDLPSVYDNLLASVNGAYRGYTAIYGFILNEKRESKQELKPFTPSDHKTRQKRPSDKRILQADGRTLWAMALDEKKSLHGPYTRPDVVLNVYQQVFETLQKISNREDSEIVQTLVELSRQNFGM
jgi:hypothetical protein